MTPVDIEKLKELVNLATPRPWGVGSPFEANYLYGAVQSDGSGEHLACLSSRKDDGKGGDSFDPETGSEACANAALIVALVNAAPALIAKAERVDALTEAMTRIDALKPVPISDPHAGAQNGKILLQAKGIARNALSPKESE